MHPFAQEIQRRSGQNLSRCYQCKKCTGGCPTVGWYEWPNHAVVRLIQLGKREELVSSKAVWMCVSCETCGTRCPNGIYLSPVFDALRALSLEEGRVAEPAVVAFHKAFVGSARRFGRVHEATMLLAYKWAAKDFFTDLAVGMKLFFKGKIPLLPRSVKGKHQLRQIFEESKGKT